MTDQQLEQIFRANNDQDHVIALRGVYNAGWYAGAVQVMSASSADKVPAATAPVNVIKLKRSS